MKHPEKARPETIGLAHTLPEISDVIDFLLFILGKV